LKLPEAKEKKGRERRMWRWWEEGVVV
jgi:hypothetical protein